MVAGWWGVSIILLASCCSSGEGGLGERTWRVEVKRSAHAELQAGRAASGTRATLPQQRRLPADTCPCHHPLRLHPPSCTQAFELRGAGAVLHGHSMNAFLATLLHPEAPELRVTHCEMIKGIAGQVGAAPAGSRCMATAGRLGGQ